MRAVIGGGLGALVVSVVWLLAAQHHPTPVAELRDLAASPLCLGAGGLPRPGSPTVGQAWQRTMGQPLDRAQAVYHGDRSIELQVKRQGTSVTISFVRVAAHRWQSLPDPTTEAWVAQVCRGA